MKQDMKNNLILKMVDGSYKECEVTGRDMGGMEEYEIPFHELKPGFVRWPQAGIPNHSVEIGEVGEDFVVARIYHVAGQSEPWATIHAGESVSTDYWFGEWSYSCTLTLCSKE